MAAAAWERFLNDLAGAAPYLCLYLRRRGVLDRDLSDEWAAWLSFTWVGATPKSWVFAEYARNAEIFRDVLKEAQKVRLIDASIVTVARSHGWPCEGHRLPAAWFRARVPDIDSRYPGAEFWGGQRLHRLSP